MTRIWSTRFLIAALLTPMSFDNPFSRTISSVNFRSESIAKLETNAVANVVTAVPMARPT
jgi:hypothetical protein